jgi:DNA-binding GntR family transcriptional regulator
MVRNECVQDSYVLGCVSSYADVMSVNADDPRPPRVQMADALRAEIQDGRLAAGKRLPSIRDFAARFDVSPNTAQAAVDILKAEGLLVSHGNRGMFVADPAESADQSAGSPEFLAITRHLESLDEAVRSMAERLQELETEVRTARGPAQ